MSLFKVKDWWSVQCGSAEDFDNNSLCIANIDNNPNGSDKVIVGSLSGILRIFSINSNTSEDGNLFGYQASDLLMEVDFKIPILQVSAGLLLSATSNVQLAVLHPRKLSIYSISSTAGVTEHGSSYNILLIYEHILQRSAYNMTIGSFGQVKGKDFFCVQSLDGNLSFYEQESLAFSRFLPNTLLPGVLAYVPHSDSFILATSSWTIESYRYQVLAIANNDANNVDNKSHVKGRKVTADWAVTLGESVIEMKVVLLEKFSYYLVILGERNLYSLKENGNIWFMKKFDFNPSCLFAYANESNDSIISLVATHNQNLLIYCNDTLKWATQLPFTPIAIHRAFFSNLTGAIVCLSDEGLLCCGYLGTNPSIKIVSVPNTNINKVNYSESELELQELKKIITSHNLGGNKALSNNETETKSMRNDLIINICDVQTISAINGKISSNPMFKLSVQLESTVNLSNIRMTVEMHKSLIAEPNIVTIPSIRNNTESMIYEMIIWKDSQLFPASTKVSLIVTYINEDGAPRIASKSVYIPINIFVKLGSPTKEAEHKLCFDIINSGQSIIHLSELFSDLYDSEDVNRHSVTNITVIDLEIYDNQNIVSVMTSVKSMNQKFIIQSDSFGGLAFIANELLRRLGKNNIKYDTSVMDISFIPLNKLFVLIDQHLLARFQVLDLQNSLSISATQFRAIQKRLLIKLKDRNPTPLNNLETLLKVAQTQITSFGDKLQKAINELYRQTSYLSSTVNLITNLVLIATEMKCNSFKNIESIFSHHISYDFDEGWEERTELALITLLDSYGKEMSNAAKFAGELTIPENCDNLKRLINILVNRLISGENFNNKDINNHKNFLNKNEAILEEDENSEINHEQSIQK